GPDRAAKARQHARDDRGRRVRAGRAHRARGLARSLSWSNRSWRESTESTEVHSGVDRLDADGTRVSGQESTNPPIPGFVKNNTPSWRALGNHERHRSGAVR